MSRNDYFPQPSVMTAQKHFSEVPSAEIPRSTFDRSHAYKTTHDAGYLIPVFCDEVLPGDTFDLKQTTFARLATPLKPIMDNIKYDTHFFFVPYRLVWDNWQAFMGERRSPSDDPNDYSVPQTEINIANLLPHELPAYFGLPIKGGGGVSNISVSALPFRAYFLIWNEWYRDQNLQNPVDVPLDDGPDTWDDSEPLRRGKRHDYFTSCLPWPQKGDPVLVPFGDTAPVYVDTVTNAGQTQPWGVLQVKATGSLEASNPPGSTNSARLTGLADLASASAIPINDLRTAFQIQRLLERDARGGTRYIELILSHFGVQSDDGRLQRPEYLGGGTSDINVNPIAQTSVTASTPQGNLAAMGTTINRSGFTKSFTEHGIIIGLASARADLTYQQGVERFWSRQTRYEFYWPSLSHLGEQAVLNKEIFAQGGSIDEQVFGYQERYAEYRYKPSRITGLFASNASSSLDVWHLSQDFASLPVLNSSFIEDNPPIDRVIAVNTEPHFLVDIWFSLRCTRPMPVYSVPGLIDHF